MTKLQLQSQIDSLQTFTPFISKVRGGSVEEKLEQLIQRYEKVVHDSSSDHSPYRVKFSEIHSWALETLKSDLDWGTQSAILDFIQDAFQKLEEFYDSPVDTLSCNGTEDALSIIILELYEILE